MSKLNRAQQRKLRQKVEGAAKTLSGAGGRQSVSDERVFAHIGKLSIQLEEAGIQIRALLAENAELYGRLRKAGLVEDTNTAEESDSAPQVVAEEEGPPSGHPGEPTEEEVAAVDSGERKEEPTE